VILHCHLTARSHLKRLALDVKSLFIIIRLNHTDDSCADGDTVLVLLLQKIAMSNAGVYLKEVLHVPSQLTYWNQHTKSLYCNT
jgi:hypothetical protein